MSSITFRETWQGWLEGWPQLELSEGPLHSALRESDFYMAVQSSMHCIGKQSLMSARFKERD